MSENEKYIELKTPYVTDYGTFKQAVITRYAQNGNFAIILINEDDDDLVATVNIELLSGKELALDANNLRDELSDVQRVLQDNDIISSQTTVAKSGFATYPVFELTVTMD